MLFLAPDRPNQGGRERGALNREENSNSASTALDLFMYYSRAQTLDVLFICLFPLVIFSLHA